MSTQPIRLLFDEVLTQQAEQQGRSLTKINREVGSIIFTAGIQAIETTRKGEQSKTFRFVSAPTGSSKSNSAKAFAIALAQHDPEFTCGFIVEEISTAQEIYDDLCEALPPEDVAVWSSQHDTTIETMQRTRIVIFTHAKWLSEMSTDRHFGVRHYRGKLRDVLFIDEQPEAIQIMEKTSADILKVRDDVQRCDPDHEWVTMLTEVGDRMYSLLGSDGDELEAASLISCLEAYDFTEDKARAFWRDHHGPQDSSGFIEGIRFLQACSLGYCFLTRRSPRSFVAYLPSFNPEPNQVILDATADLSGLYPLLGGEGYEDIPMIDYSNLKLHHIEQPKEFKSVRSVVEKRPKAEAYAKWMKETVMSNTKPGDRVLVVMHKAMIETHGLFQHSPMGDDDVDTKTFPDRLTNVIWWGSGIGSNRFKGCTQVFMFSEFYQPRRTSVAKTLGATQRRADEASLSKLNGKLTGDYLSIQEGDILRWTKQLACRGNVRNVDQDGKCGAMTLHTSMDFKRLIANLERLFPGTEPPVRTLRQPNGNGDNPKRRQRLMDILSTTDRQQVSFKDLESETGIESRSISRELQSTTVEPTVDRYGWAITSSKSIGRPGNGKWIVKKSALFQKNP